MRAVPYKSRGSDIRQQAVFLFFICLLPGFAWATNDVINPDSEITDEQAAEFMGRLQRLTKEGDPVALSKLMHYPLRYSSPDQPYRTRQARTPAEFIANFANIFTTDVKLQITCKRFEELFSSYQGVMIASCIRRTLDSPCSTRKEDCGLQVLDHASDFAKGTVWFSKPALKGPLRVIAIWN